MQYREDLQCAVQRRLVVSCTEEASKCAVQRRLASVLYIQGRLAMCCTVCTYKASSLHCAVYRGDLFSVMFRERYVYCSILYCILTEEASSVLCKED